MPLMNPLDRREYPYRYQPPSRANRLELVASAFFNLMQVILPGVVHATRLSAFVIIIFIPIYYFVPLTESIRLAQ